MNKRFYADRLFGLLLGIAITVAGAGLTVAHAANSGAAPAPHPMVTAITGNNNTGPLFGVNNYGVYNPHGSGEPVGLYGYAKDGNGVVGKTKHMDITMASGVEGLDISTGTEGINDGVLGSTTNGVGVDGVSNGGMAIVATDLGAGFGVVASSTSGVGVAITSYANTAIQATTSTTNTDAPPVTVSSNGNFTGISTLASDWDTGVLTLSTFNDETHGYASLIHAYDQYNNVKLMDLAQSGYLYLHGTVVSNSSAETVVSTTSGAQLLTYAPRVASPTMEDTGEAQLVRGLAYVRIDPALAATLDSAEGYTVLITPEGETRGVYVTQKSRSGFYVREGFGGTSTLSFGYRIVGRASGEIARPRLADMRLDRGYALFSTHGPRHAKPAALSSALLKHIQRLKAHVQ